MLRFVFKQKTAYDMRISDGSSDVCASDPCDAGFPRRRCRGSIARQVARLLLDSSWPSLPASPPAVCEHPATVVYGCGFRARLDPMYVHGSVAENAWYHSVMRDSDPHRCRA